MTTEKFQELKDRIDNLKEKKAKAKGSMDSIEKGWKQEYNFSTVEELPLEVIRKRSSFN